MTTTEQILTAAKTLGTNGRRVWLRDLRAAVAGSREQVDAALLALESEGEIILVSSDNPRAIGAEDKAAELRTPANSPRHFFYLVEKRAPRVGRETVAPVVEMATSDPFADLLS